MKKYLIVLSASWIVIILYFIYLEFYSPENKIEFIQGGNIQKAQTIDSLQNLVDSITAENYPCQIELNRYRVAFEIFMRRNPEAAEQYSNIISEETE
jgi:hypothetical protein